MVMIEAAGLRKRFGTVEAVKGVSFVVERGELFGLLGPNGAGKTTTINMLTGLARPDAGTICIGGIECEKNPKAAQHLIGVVPDESNLYPELSGFDNLCFCAALYGMGKAERRAQAHELLEKFALADAGQRKFADYSKGMKRKLTIAAGIIHRPPILFLDEPTSGIDVASARQIRQLILDLRRAGATILLTTHYIEEAERLCDRVAFIVAGQIVRDAAIAELMQPVKGTQRLLLSLEAGRPTLCAELAAAFPQYIFQAISAAQIRVEASEPIPVGPLARFLESAGVELTEARRLRPSLEDIFVQMTGIEAGALHKEKERLGGSS